MAFLSKLRDELKDAFRSSQKKPSRSSVPPVAGAGAEERALNGARHVQGRETRQPPVDSSPPTEFPQSANEVREAAAASDEGHRLTGSATPNAVRRQTDSVHFDVPPSESAHISAAGASSSSVEITVPEKAEPGDAQLQTFYDSAINGIDQAPHQFQNDEQNLASLDPSPAHLEAGEPEAGEINEVVQGSSQDFVRFAGVTSSPSDSIREHNPRLSVVALSDATRPSTPSVHRAWSETSLSTQVKHEVFGGKKYESPANFSISPELKCRIFVEVDGQQLLPDSISIKWCQEGEYDTIKNKIYRLVKEHLENKYDPEHKPNFCRIEGWMSLVDTTSCDADNELNLNAQSRTRPAEAGVVRREELLRQEHWAWHLPIMVGGYCAANPKATVHLEIRFSFVVISIPSEPGRPLAAQIWRVVQDKLDTNWDDQKFLSVTWVNPIFSRDIVHRLITEDDVFARTVPLTPTQTKKFVNYVYQFAQRLLAICVCSSAPLACLHQLFQSKKKDQDLPLTKLPEGADEFDFRTFLKEQKQFAVFTFETSQDGGIVNCENIPIQKTIPIINAEFIGKGGFGKVYKVEIHSRYHNFKETSFALKCLSNDTPEGIVEYDEEMNFLMKLAQLDHTAVTIPIAVWRQGKQCCMLLPLAESNLKEYLANHPPPPLTKTSVLGLIGQIISLADAIHSIHYLKPSDLIAPGATQHLSPKKSSSLVHRTGYHHDLKPENILIFPGAEAPHLWKIADFGTAKIHALSGGGSHLERHLKAGDPDYSAPDWNTSGATSRPYDIWSFGCILLEVLLWVFDSNPLRLDEFANDRWKDNNGKLAAFWTLQSGEIDLCPSVRQKLDFLEDRTKAFAPFGKLVDVTRAALRIQPTERPDALRLLGELEIIQMQMRLNLRAKPGFYLEAGNRELPFASFPSTMLDDALSSDSRSVESQTARRPSLSNLQVPGSPTSPRPRSNSLDSKRSRRSTDSIIRGSHASDTTGMGAHIQDSPHQHHRSESNPQIKLNDDPGAMR